MLKKLLNWEVKATARLFIPLYATLILFALINRFLSPFSLIGSSTSFNLQVLISYITIAAYFAIIIGVVAMTLIIMIQRFYKSLLGDEGYLMFTLPAEIWKHITSKLLVASLWTILSLMVTVTSILLISKVRFVDFIEQLNIILSSTLEAFGPLGTSFLSFSFLITIASGILMVYAAITLGHLFSRHKLIASFAMYCVLYIATQFITAVCIMVLRSILYRYFSAPIPAYLTIVIFLSLVYILALSAVYFSITNVLLKRKLNLE